MAYLKYDGTVAPVSATATTSLYSAAAAETFTGTSIAEAFWGGAGDRLVGGGGDDSYYLQATGIQIVELAGGGVDTVIGWQNLDLTHYANVENLQIYNDGLYGAGNALDNVIKGAAGVQQLYGGQGQDVLFGGAGADTFIVVKGQGNDIIQDFAIDDKVRLTAGFSAFDQVQAHLTQVGADVKLDLGGGDGLMFRNLAVGQLSAANFQLEAPVAAKGALTFAEEFSGPLSLWDAAHAPTGVWRADYGYQGQNGAGSYTLVSNGEKQIYTSPYFRDHAGDFAESPFVTNADGTLSIWAKASSNPEIFGYGYTSGMISTKASFSQTYGFFEMRADVPEVAGTWPAFWLVPADGSWPPELDVMETLGGDARVAWTTEHSSVGGHTQSGQANYVPDTADGMHTYGVLWTASDLVWYIDGVEVFHTATPSDMNKPMYMIANLALGGWAGTIKDPDLSAEFKIDYIRAWALGSTPSANPALTLAANNILRSSAAAAALSPTSSLADIVQAADATTSVATLTYQFFTGKIPTLAGIDYLVSPFSANPNNINSAYYQSFNLENRYINFAVNLGKEGEGKAAFAAQYGAVDLLTATKQAYAAIFGSAPTDQKAHDLLDASLGVVGGHAITRADYFAAYGLDGPNGVGTKAAMVGWLLAEAEKADLGLYAHANTAFLTDLADGASFAVDLIGVYGKPEYALS
ncbi:MAG: endo,3,4-beta-glycanase, C-terminal secretion signal protein [Caulobacter sp.]|nr:endo,3,4-beta-glycanase, C-terminal secretion signal protein [Caulobacter sp.]